VGTGILIWLYAEVGRICSNGAFRRRPEELGLQLHLGLAIVVPIVLLAGMYSVTAAEFLLFFPALAFGVRAIFRIMRSESLPANSARLGVLEWASIIVTFATLSFSVVAVTAPATSWDATTAHLAIPAGYGRADRIELSPGNVYSAYPQFMPALFALGINAIDDLGVSGTVLILAIAAAGSVYGLARQLGGREAGLVAMAMFATSPLFITQSSSVAIDLPFTGFIASALLALLVWDESRTPRYLAIAGVIVGASCGIRHTGYLAALLMFGWVLIQSRDSRAKSGAIFAAAAFAASAPWWLRSWILVGNPVYPLLTSVFGDGGMPDVQVTALLQHGTARNAGLLDFLTFPWRIAMHPDSFDGWQASPGGLVVALGVVGVLFGGRLARWLGGFSLAGFVTIYMVQRFARYLFPFLMPLHVAGALVATRPGPLRRPIAALLIVSYMDGLGLAVGTSYFKWPVVFGLESREDYLSQRVERYTAFQWINEHVPEDATVLTLDPRSYYIRRSSFQNLAALAQLSGETIDAQLEWMAARGIRYILIPDAYVASSPVFREWGITPLIDGWRGDARFRAIYDEDLPELRGGGTEHVTVLEVVWGGGDGAA